MPIILGIDPGSRVTGYGVLEENKRQLRYIASGCIRTIGETAAERLLQIFEGLSEVISLFQPSETAIEQIFMHQNANAALVLGQARGVALLAASHAKLPICEYAARLVKQAVVGYGAAKKEQVQEMVVQLLCLNKRPPQDASDALAIAICHSHMRYYHALFSEKGEQIK